MALQYLQRERIKKLKNLQKLGINPYPSKLDSGHGSHTRSTSARMTLEIGRDKMGK